MNAQLQYQVNYDNYLPVFEDAIKVARTINIDEIRGSSFRRVPSNKTLSDMLEIAKDRSLKNHFSFIYRDQSFLPFILKDGKNKNRDFWDLGFNTMTNDPDYFLFIQLEVEDGFDIVEKHNLKLR